MIAPRWRKILRDLWFNKTRTVLIVLAIAVGVAAFGGVFTARDMLLEAFYQGYESTNPSDIQIALSADEAMVQAVQAMPEVTAVEGRSYYPVSAVFPRTGADYDMTLGGAKELELGHIDQLQLEAGRWPERRELVLERRSAAIMGVQPGDVIVVEVPDGRQFEMTVTGIVRDFAADPVTEATPYPLGYVTIPTLTGLGHPALYDELLIVSTADGATRCTARQAGDVISQRLSRYGVYGAVVSASARADHWAAVMINAITAIMTGIGVLTLALSCVLVINTTTAVMVQEQRQIGMMKAVGAMRRDVAGIYRVKVILFGVLALVVAVPLSFALAWGIVNAMTGRLLTFDVAGFSLTLWILGLEIVAAVLIPLLAAFIPLGRGMRVSVHTALTDYGITQQHSKRLSQGAYTTPSVINQLFGLTITLSLRNTFRQRRRLLLTLLTLTVAGAIFIGVFNVRESLMLELDGFFRVHEFDVQITLDQAYPSTQVERMSSEVDGVEYVETWQVQSARIITTDDKRGEPFDLYGVPPDSIFFDPTILAGRWLQPGDNNAIVLGSDILNEEADIQVGDAIRLELGAQEHLWQVVGIIQLNLTAQAYTSVDALNDVLGTAGQTSLLVAKTTNHSAEGQTAVADRLADTFKASGIGVNAKMTRQTLAGIMQAVVNFVVAFLMAMALLLAVVGALSLAGTLSLNVIERWREIGVMRALGASNGYVRRVVWLESTAIGLLSWLCACLASLPLSIGFSALVGVAFIEKPLLFALSGAGYLLWLGIVIIIGTLASIVPAQQVIRSSIRDIVSYR